MHIALDLGYANRLLLVLERIEQNGSLDPALADLRERIRGGLTDKSSGDTNSAPSSGNAAGTGY